MKQSELPEEDKWYTVDLGNGNTFSINGINKANILAARTTLIELPKGEVINRNFIKCIKIDHEMTKDKYKEKIYQRELAAIETKKLTAK